MRDYRQHHPRSEERYADLEFLFVLAATAVPCEVHLSDRYLRNNFAVKSGLHADLLRQILHGTKLIKSELEKQLETIRKRFKSFLVFQGESELRVAPEAAEVLLNLAEELQLPRVSLAHLFWAVFWYESVTRQAIEAVWMHKLAHHILNADVSVCRKEDALAAMNTLFQAALFAIRGCFRAAVLSPIPALIRCANSLISDLPQGGTTADRAALAELSGGVYMVLGDQAALEAFVDLNSALVNSGPALVQTARNELVTSGLEPKFRDFILTAPENIWRSPSVEQLRLRAMWLALTVYPLLNRSDGLLFETIRDSYKEIDEIRERMHDRLAHADSVPLRTGDMVNLSLALWCSALQLRLGPEVTLNQFRLDPFTVEGDGMAALLEKLRPYKRLSKLADFASDCIAAAGPKDNERRAGNFVTEALARDVTITAAATLVAACHLLRTAGIRSLPEDLDQRVSSVFSDALAALKYRPDCPTAVKSLLSADVSARVNELMDLCTVMWHTLGMQQMRHFMTVRQTQFDALCGRTTADNGDDSLLRAEGAILDGNSFTALIANCVAADSLIGAGELKTFYVARAASVAVEGGLGRVMRQEFARLVIGHGHSLRMELGKFVDALLDPSGEDALEAHLHATEPAELAAVAVMYMNAARYSNDDSLKGKVLARIQDEINRRGDLPEVRDVKMLLAIDRIQDEAKKGRDIDAEAEFETWRAHSGSWLFPLLLQLLYGQNRNEHLRSECISVLDHDASQDTSNCCLLLASALAHEFDNRKDTEAQIVAQYLKSGICKWKSHLTAEANVATYKNLYRLDPDNCIEYLQEVEHWQKIQIHRDHLRRLPELLAQHRFFLLFAHYFRSNLFWGLQVDMDPQALQKKLLAQNKERRAAISDWKKQGGTPPTAFKALHKQVQVCADFLVLGTYLFEPPLASDRSLEEERRRFDMEAEHNLPKLLKLVMQLPNLPLSIKNLLYRHSERLYHYSLPQDLPEHPFPRAAAV